MTFEIFHLQLSLLVELGFMLAKLDLFCFLFSTNFDFLRLKLSLEVVIIDLELVELVLVGFFVRRVPVILCVTVNHRVYIQVVLMSADQDTITVLEFQVLSHQLTVHLD